MQVLPPFLPLAFLVLPVWGLTEIQLSPDGPISTPAAARDAARAAAKPAVIRIAKGTYRLDRPLTFEAADSQVTWQAEPGARPVFSGGQPIGGWRIAENGLWKTQVAGRFEQLWINGRRAIRARSPDRGFFHMEGHASPEVFPAPGALTAEQWRKSLRSLGFTTSLETFTALSAIAADERPDVTLIVPHIWDVHHYRLDRLDARDRSVLMRGPQMRELLRNPSDGRFFVENFRAALDSPGEWFLDREDTLWYFPLPGETPEAVEAIAPVAEAWLRIDGARDLTFRGIRFLHQQWITGPEGYGDPQASHRLGAAIEVDRSDRIVFDRCEIARTGTYAIWFRDGCRHGELRNSHLHDLGAGGVRIGPTDSPGAVRSVDDAATSFIAVDNNIIQHGGRIFPDAVAVLLGHASNNEITHNDIGDFYYTGISSGWHWGYGETRSHNNRFENNHIHHLGWGVTSDMGGFYNLGAAFGTVVRGNRIHHIRSYDYGGWGLYADEGSSGVLMENNLVHDTSESGFHQHYGFYNTVRNNIFAFGEKGQIQRSRAENRLSFIYENNIVVWDPSSPLLHGKSAQWEFNEEMKTPGDPRITYVMRNNLYWPWGGRMPERLAGKWTWQEWREQGRDQGSIVADPWFVDIGQRDFRLKPGSPAASIGFKAWNLSAAGVRKDGPDGQAWRDLASKGSFFPNWEADSRPWPTPPYRIRRESFEFRELGSQPLPRAKADTENRGDSIGVTAEAASPIPRPENSKASGRRSLKLQDAAGLQHAYHPVLELEPQWRKGVFHLSFDIMGTEGADWFAELRAGHDRLGTGPYLAWKQGKLTAGPTGAHPLADLLPNEWIRISLTAWPGSGRWSVRLIRENGNASAFENLPCDAGWDLCQHIVWSSLSDAATAIYLDNLEAFAEPEETGSARSMTPDRPTSPLAR